MKLGVYLVRPETEAEDIEPIAVFDTYADTDDQATELKEAHPEAVVEVFDEDSGWQHSLATVARRAESERRGVRCS